MGWQYNKDNNDPIYKTLPKMRLQSASQLKGIKDKGADQ